MSTPSKTGASGAGSTPDRPPPTYITPTKRAGFAPSAEAGPSRRPGGAGASPAYSSRRHSLYGIEDRVVIDPGSRVWKVGFSGEADSRASFWAVDKQDENGAEAWTLDMDSLAGYHSDRKEAERLIRARVIKNMREVYHKHLLTDAKARKVIIVENTFLPAAVKEAIAEALFDNLKVSSLAFTPASLLALVACGRITGLVVDVGWLETTITPVSFSRPLLHLSRSTTLAGRVLHQRVRALLRHRATYHPPPSSKQAFTYPAGQPLSRSLITEAVVQRVITTGCFAVAGVSSRDSNPSRLWSDNEEDIQIAEIEAEFAPRSTAAEWRINIPHVPAPRIDASFGTLVVPGWIRERVAEMFFDSLSLSGDTETLPDSILGCLCKLPIDLRQTMAGNILVTGGTASMPGFISRLRSELYERLHSSRAPIFASSETPPIGSPAHTKSEAAVWRRRSDHPYSALSGLAPHLSILNDPSPLTGPGSSKGGDAPRWKPGLTSWIGGSLAGAMKVSGPEVTREEYDTLMHESEAAAEDWRARLDEAMVELQTEAGADSATTATAAAPGGGGSGLELEALRPGEAVGAWQGKRKRGWRKGRVLDDWTTGTPVKA